MTINDALISELQYEAATTRKVLERIPAEKYDWKPHEKSMSMYQLATHVADMFGWYRATLEQDGLDFADGYEQPKPADTEALVALFDENVKAATESLQRADPESFAKDWTLRSGEHILFTMPKMATLRTFVVNHIVHHRGQLSVYLRLNDIPVPALYGPSADEEM
jgi:uncharacterized damage-inducible protein DinB